MCPNASKNFHSGETDQIVICNQFQESTGAKIVIIQDSSEFADEKPLRITGSPDGVERAKEMVIEILNQNDVSLFLPKV